MSCILLEEKVLLIRFFKLYEGDCVSLFFIILQAIEYDPDNRPDRNPMNTTDTINVVIEDVNDKSPTFNLPSYTYEIAELTNINIPDDYQQLSGDFQIIVTDEDSVSGNKKSFYWQN